ncbi:MAG: sugar ABC transporter substrate-binding protein, partial [bacterium]|nr:sugar ABC transporter substrate-binding protein [bacterium]
MRSKLIVILFFCLSIVLGSCQRNQPTSEKVVTLRMSTWSSEGEMAQNKQIFNAFEKSHPNIKIKLMYTPWNNYTEKILVLTVGGTPPDVMWVITDALPYFASRNVMLDITDRVASDTSIDTTKYFPHALEICSYKGRLYAMPRDVCCWFYAYNQDMFDEAKVPYPSPDWTWDDFLNICKKLTKDKNGDGRIDQFGTWWYYWGDVARQNGGSVLRPDGTECWIDRPEFYEAIQFWANLSLKFHVAPLPAEAGGFGGDLFQ